MGQKCILKESVWKVFDVFVEEPLKIHYIKEISRKIALAPTSVKKHIQKLEKQNLITKKQGERFKGYLANRENQDFLFYKKISNMIRIKESGLLDSLIETLYPRTIVLYGSYLRGEDIETSDIDLAIISKSEKKLNLDKFEKILNRKVHILIEKSTEKLNPELKSEVINGLVLYGYLKING